MLSGFHLGDGDIIPKTVTALAAETPAVVVPAHRTSWKAQQALAGLPGVFRPNAVGSCFQLSPRLHILGAELGHGIRWRRIRSMPQVRETAPWSLRPLVSSLRPGSAPSKSGY